MNKVYRVLRDCTIQGIDYKVGDTPNLPEEVGDPVMDENGHAIAKSVGVPERDAATDLADMAARTGRPLAPGVAGDPNDFSAADARADRIRNEHRDDPRRRKEEPAAKPSLGMETSTLTEAVANRKPESKPAQAQPTSRVETSTREAAGKSEVGKPGPGVTAKEE